MIARRRVAAALLAGALALEAAAQGCDAPGTRLESDRYVVVYRTRPAKLAVGLDLERLHTHGEQLLRPLKLSERESDDLIAFLESLTDPGATAPPETARPVAGCNP